jgi:DNA-directed RNA polymerase subunit RPC12/RpoP
MFTSNAFVDNIGSFSGSFSVPWGKLMPDRDFAHRVITCPHCSHPNHLGPIANKYFNEFLSQFRCKRCKRPVSELEPSSGPAAPNPSPRKFVPKVYSAEGYNLSARPLQRSSPGASATLRDTLAAPSAFSKFIGMSRLKTYLRVIFARLTAYR